MHARTHARTHTHTHAHAHAHAHKGGGGGVEGQRGGGDKLQQQGVDMLEWSESVRPATACYSPPEIYRAPAPPATAHLEMCGHLPPLLQLATAYLERECLHTGGLTARVAAAGIWNIGLTAHAGGGSEKVRMRGGVGGREGELGMRDE